MKEIGGYFELELNKGEGFHPRAIALNSARNCLKYILQAQNPTKVYVPAYSCDSLIEPLQSENIDYEFYSIDENFELVVQPVVKENEKIIYINYFALKSKYCEKLAGIYGDKFICDNTQAFFQNPIEGIDTFYSPRKFFGVADGGFLYTTKHLGAEFEQDESSARMEHVLGRHETSASAFYIEYQASEQSLSNQPIKMMSKLTEGILNAIDFQSVALARQRNFWMLHAKLGRQNLFKSFDGGAFVPMVYPLKIKNNGLRDVLLNRKIYVAKYWAEAKERCDDELGFIENLMPLPIDQRYGGVDMQRIINIVESNG